ncbi:MAG: hypothetical protein GEU94_09600 [Micromonosporaceae bacterium]|nr:hypothetical protein [Micromonosporaceae bacterium]
MTERDTDTGAGSEAAESDAEHVRPHRSRTGQAAGDWLKRTTSKARLLLAKTIWILALLAALLLGLGALLIALKANPDNVLVATAVGAAEWLDGPFADVFRLESKAREALVNWGLAAVAYLIAGGILARLVRP